LSFQSTPPRGRRLRPRRTDWRHSVSIHASTREATQQILRLGTTLGFNPRLHEGGDSVIVMDVEASLVSIHASTREATYAQTV